MKTYQCLDCSYQGQRFKQGRCPACGSANVKGGGDAADGDVKRKPYGLIICVGLWIYLAWEISQRYLG